MSITKLNHKTLKAARPTLEELKTQKPFPIVVIAENIRSLYNVGSIFRTSDGAYIEKLYLCGYTGYPPRKEIDKTALGSVESVNWEYCQNPQDVVAKLKEKNYTVIALEHTDASKAYTEITYDFPVCIIIGNEVEGVSKELLQTVDQAIEIPMYGLKQSLNVAVAYGVVVYHIVQTAFSLQPSANS